MLSASPSRLVYIPGESSLTRDGPLPLDGERGSEFTTWVHNSQQPSTSRYIVATSAVQQQQNSIERSINQTIDLISELQDENKETYILSYRNRR